MNSCVYREGGGKLYEATASTEEGVMFIKLYNVKYICEGVWGIFWTDFYRSQKGSFAIDVGYEKIFLPTGEVVSDNKYPWLPDPTGITGGAIRFRPLKQEYVDIFGLKPSFSWWEKNGSLVITVIILMLGAKAINSSQKTQGPVSWWAVIILMTFVLLFVVLLRFASIN